MTDRPATHDIHSAVAWAWSPDWAGPVMIDEKLLALSTRWTALDGHGVNFECVLYPRRDGLQSGMTTPQDPREESSPRPPSETEVTGHDNPDSEDAASLKKQHANDQSVRRVEAGEDKGAGAEGHAAAFEMWTDEELHARAAELNLDVSGLSRAEIIQKIKHH